MRFLTKIGQVLAKATAIAAGFAPMVQQFTPDGVDRGIIKGIDTLDKVADIIVTVEGVGVALKLPGDQKLLAAAPLVAQAVLQSSVLSGKEIGDPELFKAGCTKMASGMADVLNSLKADSLKVIEKA